MAATYRDKNHFKSQVLGSYAKDSLMIGLIEPDVYCFGFYTKEENAPKFYYVTFQLYNYLDSDLEEKQHFFGGGQFSLIYGINYRRREAFFAGGNGLTYIIRPILSCFSYCSEKFNIAREIRYLPENDTQQAIIRTLRKRYGLGKEVICRENLFEMASLRAFSWYATYMAYVRASSPSSHDSSSSSELD